LGSKKHAMRVMKGKDLILARTKHKAYYIKSDTGGFDLTPLGTARALPARDDHVHHCILRKPSSSPAMITSTSTLFSPARSASAIDSLSSHSQFTALRSRYQALIGRGWRIEDPITGAPRHGRRVAIAPRRLISGVSQAAWRDTPKGAQRRITDIDCAGPLSRITA
jgi:hypothetical protein